MSDPAETHTRTHTQHHTYKIGLSHYQETNLRILAPSLTHTHTQKYTHSLELVSTPLGAQWLLHVASSSLLHPSLHWNLLSPFPPLWLRVQHRLVLCPSLHPHSWGRPCNRGCPGPAPAQFLHPSPPPLGPPCWSRPGASSARPPPH